MPQYRPVRSKIEWIYTRTKVSGQESHELALIMKKKETRIDKMHFFYNFKKQLVQAYLIVSMDV